MKNKESGNDRLYADYLKYAPKKDGGSLWHRIISHFFFFEREKTTFSVEALAPEQHPDEI